MAEDKGQTAAPQASAAQVSSASTLPERPKPVTAEELGLEVEKPVKAKEGEETFQVPVLKAGWVKDRDGRFHEVEDVDTYVAAYPGSKGVKETEVKQSLIGYAEPKTEATPEPGAA